MANGDNISDYLLVERTPELSATVILLQSADA